jgi:predicted ribonuclease YlaK
MLKPIEDECLSITDDTRILATALEHRDEYDLTFVTNDLALKNIARIFFETDKVTSVKEEGEDAYSGYKDVAMTEQEMADFYSNPTENVYGLNINEYIIIRNDKDEVVDTLVWTGDCYRKVTFQNFKSKWFGEVKPSKGDVYQTLAADSFAHNTITMVKGPAGSGKTYLSLGFLLSQLEHHKIDKIIVFCNTVATKNSAKLGYLPGTRDEKLLDSQIGNLLISKFGGRIEVERMIQEETLLLLPMSDIRGYDTGGMRAGIYISEAQNLDIDLMKLALQRIGHDSICIIDGDEKTQVDDIHFAGVNNGMKRVSKVFRGEDVYGEVELRIIHRSKIAQIAERM